MTELLDYYLTAVDKESMRAALISVGAAIEGEDGELHAAEGISFDLIGTWYQQPADPETAPVAVQGFHANLRSDHVISWPPTITLREPETPWRVWA